MSIGGTGIVRFGMDRFEVWSRFLWISSKIPMILDKLDSKELKTEITLLSGALATSMEREAFLSALDSSMS